MNLTTIILIVLAVLTTLTSCEGFKVLTIQNKSGQETKLTLRPGIDYFDKMKINDFPSNQMPDSSVIVLQPDSSVTILSVFTGIMFNVKIQERDLRTDYLKIETPSDTIIAASREEIIDLIYKRRKGKIKGEGRNFATIKIE